MRFAQILRIMLRFTTGSIVLLVSALSISASHVAAIGSPVGKRADLSQDAEAFMLVGRISPDEVGPYQGSVITVYRVEQGGRLTPISKERTQSDRDGRYHTTIKIPAENTQEYYKDWHGRDTRMLRYTSAPLAQDVEVSGHVVVDLWLASSEGDAALHVYLSEIEPDGTARYVTEGVLRAIHRKEAAPEHNQNWSWPFRTFARADARPMPKGKPERLRFALIPTSWTFARGSRIRIAIAGADADHYAQVPHGRPPLLTIRRGGSMASSVTLPWREQPR